MDPARQFSGRIENYVWYRPDNPVASRNDALACSTLRHVSHKASLQPRYRHPLDQLLHSCPPVLRETFSTLIEREWEMLRFKAQRASNSELPRLLSLSTKVANPVSNILHKLQVAGRKRP